jgi:hypothetical protein
MRSCPENYGQSPRFAFPESLGSERIRILRECYRRGAEESDFSTLATVTHRDTGVRIVSHIVSRNTDFVQTSMATFITKRAGLGRYCVQRGRFAPLVVGGNGGDRRPQRVQGWGGYWMRDACDAG